MKTVESVLQMGILITTNIQQMKTYLITESNEPLKEGCLTQYGMLQEIISRTYGEDYGINDEVYGSEYRINHLKCVEIHNFPDKDINLEVTDPAELQQIWEAIRGEDPDRCNYDENFVFYADQEEWQNFTLEPGTYELFGNTEQPLPEEDNNGWISVLDKNPPDGEIVLYYVPEIVRTGYLLKGTWYKNLNNGEYDTVVMPDVTHWQPLPKRKAILLRMRLKR